MTTMRMDQAPASAPLPLAQKPSLGSGVPPRAPSASSSKSTSLQPPVKVQDKVHANTDESAEPATGFSLVAGSAAAAIAVRDTDGDVVERQHASVASEVSAVFEESPLKV
jgi:hypothetical protein